MLSDAITAYANRFWNGRTGDLRAALWRLAKIRTVLDQILAAEGVPSQFSAVVLVESGANPAALSPKSARGLWQFMPDTAARYGLVINDRQDDRTDLLKSTRAAARYLRDLYRTFGEWRLALAAYDAGEGALREAIQRGRSLNFDSLSDQGLIPAETRNYVPAVVAAVNLLQFQAR
jgi:membrane-bound lytic murein transglycosylase D